RPRIGLLMAFSFIVGLPLTPDRLSALWSIASRSNRWLAFDHTVAIQKYLNAAVHREAERIRRRQEARARLAERVRRHQAEVAEATIGHGATLRVGRDPQRRRLTQWAAADHADALLDRIEATQRRDATI